MPIYHLEGPPTSKVSRAQAEEKLRSRPDLLPKNAEYELWDQDGRWIAAWHTSGPFGQPADGDEESPGPKSEGPDDTAPEPPDADASGNKDVPDEDSEGDGEGGPPKGDGDKKDKGKGEDLKLDHEIYDLLQKIVVALGISDGGPEDSPVPGDDVAPPLPGGPPPGPPGAGGPPGPNQEVKHERTMKPGEAPPGTTPVGAPAFSHIDANHPWKDVIGKVASFTVEEPWPANQPLGGAEADLRRVAHNTGYRVAQVKRATNDDGQSTVRAVITAYGS